MFQEVLWHKRAIIRNEWESFIKQLRILRMMNLKQSKKLVKNSSSFFYFKKKHIHIFIATNKFERACILRVELNILKSKIVTSCTETILSIVQKRSVPVKKRNLPFFMLILLSNYYFYKIRYQSILRIPHRRV